MSDTTRGIWLMVAAMFCFNTSDALIKYLTPEIAVTQTLFMMAIGGTVFTTLLCNAQGKRPLARELRNRFVLFRTLGEISGTYAIFMALSVSDLSLVTAVNQASPLLLAAAAAMFLGERVGWRRWSSIALGFIGVLIIINPFDATFDWAVLWSVAALIGLSLRDFCTALIPREITAPQLSNLAFMSLIPMGFYLMQTDQGYVTPDLTQWFLLSLVIIFACFGMITIANAMRYGDVSLVASFRYVRILFALLIGYLLLGEKPTLMMWIGIGIVMLSGIFLLMRERALQLERNSD